MSLEAAFNEMKNLMEQQKRERKAEYQDLVKFYKKEGMECPKWILDELKRIEAG